MLRSLSLSLGLCALALGPWLAALAQAERSIEEIVACVEKAARYYTVFGHSSFAPGNADGGLTTIEEKSLGAYSKSGKSTISGLIKPGDVPPRGLVVGDAVMHRVHKVLVHQGQAAVAPRQHVLRRYAEKFRAQRPGLRDPLGSAPDEHGIDMDGHQ